jgi:hypothetical protein
VLLSGLLGRATADAQPVRLSGATLDSLTGLAFVGATVQLIPAATPGAAGQSATSDATGRFTIGNVRPGRYLFGFQHPRLDSLGFDAVSRTLDVPTGINVLEADLALPSAETLAASFCGARRDSTGVLLGRVLDAATQAPVAGGSVFVQWSELRVDAAGVRRALPRVRAPIGADGRYVACGVPTDVPVLVRAEPTDSALRSGSIDLRFLKDRPLLHRDLLVSTARSASGATRGGLARLSGRVRTVGGQPVIGATVLVRDARAPDSVATTDSTGQFRFGALPGGSYPLEVLKLGLEPGRATVDLRPDREATITVSMREVVAELARVTTRAPGLRESDAFAQRRRDGRGYFLTSDEIAKRGAFSVSQAVIAAPMLRVSGTSRTGKPVILGRSNCKPQLFLDGVQVRGDFDNIDNVIPIAQLGGIEVYDAANRPAQFGTGACETIVLWTRFYVR